LLTWCLRWVISRRKIFEALGDGRKLGVRIFYSVEEEPLGTGGAIKNAEPFITDDVFVVLNGDVLTNLSLDKLVEALGDADGAIALVPLRSPYGVVEYDTGGFSDQPSVVAEILL